MSTLFPILDIKFDQQIKKSDKYCNKFTVRPSICIKLTGQINLQVLHNICYQLRIDKWMNTNTANASKEETI